MQGYVNKHIQGMLDEIFEGAFDPGFCNFKKMELAKRAGLSYQTTLNLRKGKTRDPRYSTVIKLARAVGIPGYVAREQLGLSRLKIKRRKAG